MEADNLPAFIHFLLNPGSYPHQVDRVSLVQTHISYVLLAGEYVYKIKKPVDFGFLDFTSLEKRRHCCEQELLLNRRLCPSLYLGLVAITETAGNFAIDGPGSPVEYGVRMRRMPEDRMMSNIIAAGRLNAAHLDAIIDRLVPFYASAEGGPAIQAFGTATAVSVNVLENFSQTESFIGCEALSGKQYDLIGGYARSFLAREDLFKGRIDAGRVRDCHGDLYSANICLADEVHIYDCIEFNQRFRYCDVASDVAFLAMDLDFHGLQDLSAYFIRNFQVRSNDPSLDRMLNFYKCYRAYVRGKIGLFTAHAVEVDGPTQKRSLEMAGKYFRLAERYAASK